MLNVDEGTYQLTFYKILFSIHFCILVYLLEFVNLFLGHLLY